MTLIVVAMAEHRPSDRDPNPKKKAKETRWKTGFLFSLSLFLQVAHCIIVVELTQR